MRATFILLAYLSLLTLACTDPATEATEVGARPTVPDSTTLIVPGRRLGLIPVHARPEVLESLLKPPYRSDSGAGTTVAYYQSPLPGDTTTLTVILTMEPEDSMRKNVQIIRTGSPRYRDEYGLGVGSPRDSIAKNYALSERLASYGEGSDSVAVYATGTGLTWEIDTDGNCRGLSVHDTRRTPSPNYRPDYPEMTREYPPVSD